MYRLKLCVFCLILSFYANAENLIRFEKIDYLSKETLNETWKENGVPKLITPIVTDVDVYELYYNTSLPDGTPVVATGIYYVPLKFPYEIATLLYNHGTAMQKRKGADYDYNGESAVCKILAADGYAVAWQDYIGLGKAEGFHPYQHLETEGQSGVDLLIAIQELNKKIGLKVNEQLFITGYSQGGHATLAVHKILQENYSDKFTVTASSPMSGAHDMSGAQLELMVKPYSQPHYLPYLLYGYNKIYKMFPDEKFKLIFKPQYHHVIDKVFSKEYTYSAINDMLPELPFEMVKDSLYHLFKNNPDFSFTKALKKNNTYDWVPQSPVQFCYCKGDEKVSYKNSISAINFMHEHGARYIIDRNVSDVFNHRKCADYSVMYSKFYFDSFRNGYDKGRKGNIIKNAMVRIVTKLEAKKLAKQNS